MNKYVPISNVINYVGDFIINKLGVNTVIAHAYDAYSILGIEQRYIRYCKLVEIENGTLNFVEPYIKIADVFYYDSEPTKEYCQELVTCTSCFGPSLKEEEIAELIETAGAQEIIRKYSEPHNTFYYSIFMNNNMLTTAYSRMDYTGQHHKGLIGDCVDCQDSEHPIVYAIDKSGTLRTNMTCGYALVIYDAYPYCGDEIEILDDYEIMEYLRIAIIHRYYTNNPEDIRGISSLYRDMHSQKDTLINKIRGKYLLRGTNQKAVRQAIFGSRRLYAGPVVFKETHRIL